ncbi:hypothetical protein N9N67_06320 [Bacteriovoracaceae bacterium]|nr:hypothetical protein [Bacteriovoracaceae bacterium]
MSSSFAIRLKDLKKSSKKFTKIFNQYSKKYTGRKLKVIYLDHPVFAFAEYSSKTNTINISKNIVMMIGHMAEFDQVLCHELGHLIGKGPKDVRTRRNSRGRRERHEFLAEGQAEYFSSFCLKKLWKTKKPNLNSLINTINKVSAKELPIIKKLCEVKKVDYCEEILITHFLTKHKMAVQKGMLDLSYTKKDPRKPSFVVKGLGYYPHPYCLMENAFNSTMCGDSLQSIIMTGQCSEKKFERPPCWYFDEKKPQI